MELAIHAGVPSGQANWIVVIGSPPQIDWSSERKPYYFWSSPT
jgi:hypothetical protein